MSAGPAWFELKAIRPPSGDQTIWPKREEGVKVKRVDSPRARSTIHRSSEVAEPRRSTTTR